MSSDLTASEVSVPLSETVLSIETVIKFIKKLGFFFLIYLFGYYEFSIVLPYALLVFVIINTKWRQEKKNKFRVARTIALGYEKDVVLETFQNELPAWIKFPEIEKVEWLNNVFKLIWQQINEYTHDLVPKILEPAIQSYVSDFKFNKVILGNVPLRVDGVKVYDQEDKRKIVMDLNISYAGDCYVTFHTFRFTGGIEKIQFHGTVRVVLTPLISKMPLIGGLQIYFMNEPHIDFDLIKATSILDLPVVRNKIKNTTMNVINSMFMYPNVYSINLTQGINMSKLTVFRTEGILRVHVVEAKNLINKDLFGKSDPYVVLSCGSIRVETPVVENCLNPKWDFWKDFEIEPNSELKIEVWDKDEGSKDDSLGHAKINVAQVAKIGQSDMPIPLQGVPKGTIYIRLTWLSLSSNYDDLHTALLMIYLESSLNLPKFSKTCPNPYVELEVENETKASSPEQQTCEPLWETGFTFLLRDPKKAVLNLRIIDDDSKNKMGEVSFRVDNLKNETNMDLKRHTFFFNKPFSEASICCSMKLRVLKNDSLEEEKDDGDAPKPQKKLVKQESNISTVSRKTESEGLASDDNETINSSFDSEDDTNLGKIKLSLSYSQQRQKLIVEIHEVDLIRKRSQIYVKLYLQTDQQRNHRKKTKIAKTKTAIFNESFDYLISNVDLNWTNLLVMVKTDKGFLKKNLGRTIISLQECGNLAEPFTDWFDLRSKHEEHVYHLIK
ncbi:extended synaptotagmin-2-like [Tribolium madens]|uniref:extended synaptotagmin-2-like n=1 Tax=Tribolium madens TaxID=41895 RepID=UPI001CF72CB7|nr:extended synaptotagmin-2-like [Tribolium madens]